MLCIGPVAFLGVCRIAFVGTGWAISSTNRHEATPVPLYRESITVDIFHSGGEIAGWRRRLWVVKVCYNSIGSGVWLRKFIQYLNHQY